MPFPINFIFSKLLYDDFDDDDDFYNVIDFYDDDDDFCRF